MPTKPDHDEDGDWDYTFIEETIGIGGMLVRDGVGTPVSPGEALQWAIDDGRDVAMLGETMRLCLFALSTNDPELILVALRGIVVLRAEHEALPYREELIAQIQAASPQAKGWVDAHIQASVPAALEALRKA